MEKTFSLLLAAIGLFACGFIKIEKPIYIDSNPPVNIDTIPTRIQAPAIELDAPVVAMGWNVTEQWGEVVVEWDVPEKQAGWHRNSGAPGSGSNIVISGHNNSMGGRIFANLEGLGVGDSVTVRNLQGDSFTYRVFDKKLVRTFGASAEALDFLESVMKPTPTEQLTLITCWPSWSNTHRLVIMAAPNEN